ncbi:unnamed protein product [Mytilus coruscus]|uniref:Uncharacterized protein n=1 Tax=Mytilus coruscus TaxID=42192 RepID=A0A6J8C765_MYTCO|nr:unnamed protein product [Mytilus coruscus]
MALNSTTSTSISDGNQSLDKKEVTYTKSYTLNIEKSLTKKLNSAKRNQISYKCTDGGFTAKLDAVTFELFLNACEIYYSQSTQTFNDVKTDVFVDKFGNMNLYLTKCSILANGKNACNFINRDLIKLHEIISQTTVNGQAIDIKETNKILACRLSEVLQNSKGTKNNPTVHNNRANAIEKCYKCKRSYRSRAVYCKNKHWVHFKFERLSESEIEHLEKQDENAVYECLQCFKNLNDGKDNLSP